MWGSITSGRVLFFPFNDLEAPGRKITLEALSPRKRGPKAAPPNPLKKRVETLEKETQRLRHQLKQAEIIIEVQKTISEILHLPPDPKGEER